MITGLDLSLTSTGAARLLNSTAGNEVDLHRFKFRSPRGPVDSEYRHQRLEYLTECIETVCSGADLAAIEDMPYGIKGNAITGLAGLHWMTRHLLWRMHVPYVLVNVKVRIKWMTGNASTEKDRCLAAAIKRFTMVEIDGNDEADALMLAAMTAAHYGFPLADMPASSDEQLAKIAWPDYPQEKTA